MKIKKICIALAALSLLTACGAKEQHPMNIKDSAYQKMLDETLVSLGNTYRLSAVLQKIKNGEDVYVAALGGSVTEGAGPEDFKDGYAYQFYNKLVQKYAPKNAKNVHFDGAGLSGTPSQLGLVRYQSDVIDVLGHAPDLLIIEFAVNDSGDSECVRAFEALVRRALSEKPDAAVIALYSAATYGNTMQSKTPVAQFYQIPEVNLLKTVESAIKNGTFKSEQYYTDTVHPTKEGHAIMADALMNLLAQSEKAPKAGPAAIPQGFYAEPNFFGLKRILADGDSNAKISAGGFAKADPNGQSLKKTGKSDFPQNWYHPANTKNSDGFKLELTCKSLFFVYKEQGSWLSEKFGKADVFVDGKKAGTFDGGKSGGWNNAVIKLLIDEKSPSAHTVEVKMASGDAGKGFTILALGYTD